MTFGLKPLGAIRRALLIARKTGPVEMPAAVSHLSTTSLTQSGPERFAHVCLCRRGPQSPNALLVAGCLRQRARLPPLVGGHSRGEWRSWHSRVWNAGLSPQNAARSRFPSSAVNQFPIRIPWFFTPFTRRIPAARSGLRSPQRQPRTPAAKWQRDEG